MWSPLASRSARSPYFAHTSSPSIIGTHHGRRAARRRTRGSRDSERGCRAWRSAGGASGRTAGRTRQSPSHPSRESSDDRREQGRPAEQARPRTIRLQRDRPSIRIIRARRTRAAGRPTWRNTSARACATAKTRAGESRERLRPHRRVCAHQVEATADPSSPGELGRFLSGCSLTTPPRRFQRLKPGLFGLHGTERGIRASLPRRRLRGCRDEQPDSLCGRDDQATR